MKVVKEKRNCVTKLQMLKNYWNTLLGKTRQGIKATEGLIYLIALTPEIVSNQTAMGLQHVIISAVFLTAKSCVKCGCLRGSEMFLLTIGDKV
jgi:hypothetical protein